MNNRWLGGMLTNFKTVKKSIERFKELLATTADETKTKDLSKKDLAAMTRAIEKYRKSLDGIREMSRLPDVVFVIDVNREAIAISEAQRLGIPIVAVVDSNCNPFEIDYVIPGNDDSIRAIQLYCARLADACLEGAADPQRPPPERGGRGRAGAAGEGRDARAVDGPGGGRDHASAAARPRGRRLLRRRPARSRRGARSRR